jgi:hypothetical protein
MNEEEIQSRDEFERIRRVSNMLCSGHADLRDRYSRYAFLLDLSILALSTWIAALAFIDPKLALLVTPSNFDPQIWTGVLGTIAFFLSLLQFKVDWKGRADCHNRSLEIYAEVKRLAGQLLGSESELNSKDCKDVLSRYHMAGVIGASIPEREFLKQKRRHLTKVAISKHLDTHPYASIFIFKVKLWLRDNFKNGLAK